jgi:1-acyl-sn-glycerol-3-phosphate acyltransferase
MRQDTDTGNNANTGAEGSQRSDQKNAGKGAARNLYEPYVTPTWFYESLRLVAKIIFFLALRLHLRKRYNIPKQGPYIIAANHLDWTDIPLVPAYMPGKVVYMAKEELFLDKRIGWLVRFLGAFPVKRGEGDRQALRAADELLKRGKVLIIFPEGTRSKTHELGKAHSGLALIALRAGVPVLPVAISGSENALKKFGAQVTVSYGEPILFKPAGAKITRDDIQSATDTIMGKIAEMLPASYRGAYSSESSSAQ